MNKYFVGYPYQHGFGGVKFQRGRGLGSAFGRLFQMLSPLTNKLKEYFIPTIKAAAQTVGKEVVQSVSNIANDVLSGKKLKESAEKNLTNSVENLSNKLDSTINKQRGSSANKIIYKKINKKRRLDIFD